MATSWELQCGLINAENNNKVVVCESRSQSQEKSSNINTKPLIHFCIFSSVLSVLPSKSWPRRTGNTHKIISAADLQSLYLSCDLPHYCKTTEFRRRCLNKCLFDPINCICEWKKKKKKKKKLRQFRMSHSISCPHVAATLIFSKCIPPSSHMTVHLITYYVTVLERESVSSPSHAFH